MTGCNHEIFAIDWEPAYRNQVIPGARVDCMCCCLLCGKKALTTVRMPEIVTVYDLIDLGVGTIWGSQPWKTVEAWADRAVLSCSGHVVQSKLNSEGEPNV